jgi:penicillin-binding protein 1A
MVGGRDYGLSQFNRATDALRQPGSSFKPYVYATALDVGVVTPKSIIVDRPVCIGNWCPHNYSGGFAGAITLTDALKRSINTVAVTLSIMIGKGNSKIGRNLIVANARKMGLRTPLPDTPSLPIGADEVTVLDHVVAYATFPNLGKSVTAHAILEVKTSTGETVWRFDRDGPKPHQVLKPKTATDMIFMMNKVVEEGTGRRARLDGVRAAGKTGTTNAYRDAWFVGYTGNFVGGVWMGNDDYSPTNRMTGGALPAMTWHAIMQYAHQGIELKNLPGLPPNPPPGTVPQPKAEVAADTDTPPRPTVLTRRGAEALIHIERLMDDAARALSLAGSPGTVVPTGQQSVLEQPDVFAVRDQTPLPRTRN